MTIKTMRSLALCRPAFSQPVPGITNAPGTNIVCVGQPHLNGAVLQLCGRHISGGCLKLHFAAEVHCSRQSGTNGGMGRTNGSPVLRTALALSARPLSAPKYISSVYARPLPTSDRNLCFR